MATTESRYPFELVDVWRTRDGERIVLRPVHPQDTHLVRAFVLALSPTSRYNRFHQALNDITPGMARWATHVDYQRHLALIAVVVRDGAETEIGAARYIVGDDGRSAEFALAVADAWQRKGIGERLLRALMENAARRGLDWLEGDVLKNNVGMLALVRKLGFAVQRPRHGALTVRVEWPVQAADPPAVVRAPASLWDDVVKGLRLVAQQATAGG